MTSTLLRERNQVTLPEPIVKAAGLVPQRDLIAWSFEGGEIHGRKLEPKRGERSSEIVQDSKTGFWVLKDGASTEECLAALEHANLIRD